MSETNAIEVAVRANASQYISTMKEVGGVTTSATSQMQTGLSRFSASAKEAGAAAGSAGGLARSGFGELGEAAQEAGAFTEELTHHIRSMRQEMFLGSFMARQIGELGVASKETAGLVAGLAGAFLVGNWTGLAVEGVLKLIGAFKEMGDESKKAAAEAIKSIGELHEKVESYLASLRKETELEKLRRTELAPLEEKESAQKRELVALTDALAIREAALRKSQSSGLDLMSEKGRVELLKQQIEAKEKLLGLTEIQINAAKKALEEAGKETTSTHAIEEQEKLQDEFNQYRQQSYEKDLDNWKQHLKDVADADRQNAIDMAKFHAEQFEEDRKQYDKKTEETLKTLKAEEAEEKKAAAAKVKQVKFFANTAAEALATAAKSVLHGTASMTDAIMGLVSGLADAAINGLVKMAEQAVVTAIVGKAAMKAEAISSTEGQIASAEAGAYASQAFIPFVGPELGAAAAAQAGAFLTALTAPQLSAAGGLGEVPRDGTIIRAHEGESVLPKYIAAPMRKMFAEGEMPGGGGTVENHFHLHALVADEQSMRRFAESGAWQRAQREARRTGRAP